MPQTKICMKCLQEKDATAFRSRRNKCRECERAYTRAYNISHAHVIKQRRLDNIDICRAQERAKTKKSYRKHRKEILQRVSARYYENPQPHRERAKVFRTLHLDLIHNREHLYTETHKEQISLKNKTYYAARQEAMQERTKQWRAAHPEERRAQEKRKRARKKSAPINDLTASQWTDIQTAYDHRCVYCQKRAKGHLTQDHLTPLARGVAHTVANVVPACQSCNSRKHTGPPPLAIQPLLLTVATAKKQRRTAR